ncbi:MAG: 3-deoxy-7-phosphoheptulonate synthase [Myxococcales bacterium]|nr:3-deoxy-7-phosphoheptulonate synthase [Myxococcales bacterium]
MLIQLRPGADPKTARNALHALGLWVTPLVDGDGHVTAYTVEPLSPPVDPALIAAIPGVERLLRAPSPHPRLDAQAGRPIRIGRAVFGGPAPVLIAGPCSVDARDTLMAAAAAAAAAGATALRGGAYKPRTSPYSFHGHGPEGLTWLREAADAHDLIVVTEVLSEHDVTRVAEAADLVQIGSRNMQNFALLRAVGRAGRPVLLKRGMSATIEEWMLAAEHLLTAGAEAVVFCERGVRGFDPATRNLLDLAAVALLAHAHRQPVIADPSHATGRRDLVAPLALAARAAGACGVMVETHPDPTRALSDAPQAIDRDTLRHIGRGLGLVTEEKP